MKWFIKWTDRNGNGQQIEVDANTATEARAHALPLVTYHDGVRTVDGRAAWMKDVGDTLRVYPALDTADGVTRGAVLVTYRTALNGIMRTGGNATQWTIYKDARRLTAVATQTPTAAAIFAALSECGADVQDYVSTAYGALIDGAATGADVGEIYHGAYTALNAYIRGLRAATARELSTEYIVDGGGDLYEYAGAVASIIRGGDTWTAAADDMGRLTAKEAAALGRALTAALSSCTEVQRRIVKLLALDVSAREIARRLKRDPKTVRRHIANIRAKVADEIKRNAPEFKRLIYTAVVDRQTAAAKAEAARNAHTAEYYRAYRAAKKAAAAARAETAARATE